MSKRMNRLIALATALTMTLVSGGCAVNLGEAPEDSNTASAVTETESKSGESQAAEETAAQTEPAPEQTDDVEETSGQDETETTDTSGQDEIETTYTGETLTEGGVYNYQTLSYDAILNSCPYCQDAITHRISLTKAYNMAISHESGASLYAAAIPDLEEHIYTEMQHNCTAPTVYVQDYPLFMEPYSGLYTGYWKGAGPCGKGSFIGKNIYTYSYNPVTYKYDGDWKNGMPEGQGTLTRARNDEFYTFANYYSGDFYDGLPHGTGVIYMYTWDGRQLYFDQSSFSNGQSLGEVAYVEYDAGGKYIGTGTGNIYIDEDDISYDITSYSKAYDPSGALLVAGFVSALVLTNKLYNISSAGTGSYQQCMNDLSGIAYREAADAQIEQEAAEAAAINSAKWCGDKAREIELNYPDQVGSNNYNYYKNGSYVDGVYYGY